MPKLLLATGNEHKLSELASMLEGTPWQLFSLRDFPNLVLPPEDGETFQENAKIKAVAAAKASGMIAMADDSGLEVDCLAGAPGVHSARFAGIDKDDAANNTKLLEMLSGVAEAESTAHFSCVIAIATPGGSTYFSCGSCPGIIGKKLVGENGFGYDPLFYLPQFAKTMAELTAFDKNKISHRGQALRGALPILQKLAKES